jgi:hypothetical protein
VQRLQRPYPQVIGAPPGSILDQVRLDTRPDHRCGPQAEVELETLHLAPGAAVRQKPLREVLHLDGVLPRGARDLDGVGRELQEHLGGKGVVPGVQRFDQPPDGAKVVAAARPRQRDPNRFPSVLVARRVCCHGPTVDPAMRTRGRVPE